MRMAGYSLDKYGMHQGLINVVLATAFCRPQVTRPAVMACRGGLNMSSPAYKVL